MTPPTHAARGLAVAGLGLDEESMHEVRWLKNSEVYREDLYSGPFVWEAAARILAQASAADDAIKEIELLFGPSGTTAHMLRVDPLWDPIRSHPRFQRLLEQYEN